ncbi:MAG: adenine phosphoribosyltransferase [Nitrospiraceae bacterium]|jgi:adenine phosphoribosyltransferase|nr:adenine phosphoribosyltransferase [Nitrospiraceae bacterium]
MDLDKIVGRIPDFPKKGILFYDLMPVFRDPSSFRTLIAEMANPFLSEKIGKVVGIEARGFILGAPIAEKIGAGFVPVRKKGKLPGDVSSLTYQLEYGTDTIEIQRGAIKPGERVLLVDDLLATGGTAKAAIDLIRQQGGEVVCISVAIELTGIGGREKVSPVSIRPILVYPA